jgi:enamine deaminase RidA (YjgF/YER057c/UK114 family)
MSDFQHINPEGVFDPSRIYSHIVVPPPGRVVFLAGQWGGDLEGNLVEGGFAAQVARAFENVQTHLAAIGIGPGQVTKVTHYVVGLDQHKRAALHEIAGSIWPTDKPASTLLGVAALAREGMFYEVDVQAVIPD